MGRNEILDYIQPFLKVGKNRVFDNRPYRAGNIFLRLGHQPPHTTQLPDLLTRAPGTGVHHHIDGVEALLVFFQLFHQGSRKLRVDARPDVDNLVVALVVGNQTHVVVLPYGIYFLFGLGYQLFFFLGHFHIIQPHRQATFVSSLETEVFDVVKEQSGARHARNLQHLGDHPLQFFFGKQGVDKAYFLRYMLVEEHATGHRFDYFRFQFTGFIVTDIYPHFYKGILGNHPFVQGNNHLIGAIKHHTLAFHGVFLGTFTAFGYIIQPQYHILRRHGNRRSVGRVQDVVR